MFTAGHDIGFAASSKDKSKSRYAAEVDAQKSLPHNHKRRTSHDAKNSSG